MADEQPPLEQLLDVALYAPVGLFLAARRALREHLPTLVEAGRDQLTKQVALARMMGHYAVEEAQRDAERRVRQAESLVAEARERVAGSAGGDPAASGPASTTAPAEAAAPAAEHLHAPSPEVFPEVAAASANGHAPDASALAIPGYTSLSASQVVQRLAGLSAAQLEEVRVFESASRGRKTILGRISQLQSEAS